MAVGQNLIPQDIEGKYSIQCIKIYIYICRLILLNLFGHSLFSWFKQGLRVLTHSQMIHSGASGRPRAVSSLSSYFDTQPLNRI